MKARTTTIACFVTAGFVAIVALAYSLSNLGHMESRAADLYAGAAGPMSELLRVAADYPRLGLSAREVILAGTPTEASAASLSFQATRDDFELSLAAYSESLLADEERSAYDNFIGAWKGYSPLLSKVVAMASAGQRDAAVQALRTGDGAAAELQASLDGMIARRIADGNAGAVQAAALARSATLVNLAVVLLGLIFSAAFGLILSAKTGRRVSSGEESLKTIRKMLESEFLEVLETPQECPHPAAQAAQPEKPRDSSALPNRGLVLLPSPSPRRPIPRLRTFSPRLRLMEAAKKEART